jgi:hypothetical protein
MSILKKLSPAMRNLVRNGHNKECRAIWSLLLFYLLKWLAGVLEFITRSNGGRWYQWWHVGSIVVARIQPLVENRPSIFGFSAAFAFPVGKPGLKGFPNWNHSPFLHW